MMNCALVTGGSKGLGKAIGIQLARDHGLYILLNYSSNDEAAKKALDEIRAGGGNGELLKFSVEDKSNVDSEINGWIENNPEKSISVLVNNAGIIRDDLFVWMTEENWNKVIGVSLNGMFNVTQCVLSQMLNNKKGWIINISSVSGLKGVAGQTNYSAAKAGIIGATKSLAQEVGKMGIKVNAVAPGFIKTEMTESEDIKDYVKLIPMGRLGEPEEVAHLVSFLASEKASYITGQVISINGGLY
jgi:3-oxoacyl-[acyl-carrier protein] reductase